MCNCFRILRLVGILSVLSGIAQANVNYAYTYTAINGPLQSFSFDINSPAFITGGSLAFTPFTITDGVSNWTMTVGEANSWCMVFATAGSTVKAGPGGCTFGQNSYGSGFMTIFFHTTATPNLSSLGSFSSPSSVNTFGNLYSGWNQEIISTEPLPAITPSGQTLLAITLTPEPGLIGPLTLAIGGLSLAVRRQRKRSVRVF